MIKVLRPLPIALRLLITDPINLILASIPTLVALTIYIFSIVAIVQHADTFGAFVKSYLPDPQVAGWLGKLISGIFVILVILIMSWTYILVVGIIAAPFNSMLSSRIEKKLRGMKITEDRKSTFRQILSALGETFLNEAKKIALVVMMSLVAFLLNFFPLFYPLGMLIFSLLLAVQFIDYSWSRHDLSFSSCVKDILVNIIPYSVSGFGFLILLAVPILNTLIPAVATAYFTVLWLQEQGERNE